MIHEARRRTGARGLVVVTTMALCGVVPAFGAGAPARADGPVQQGGRAAQRPKAVKARWRPARTNVVLSTGAPGGPVLAGRVYSWPYAVTNSGGTAQSVTFTAPMPANVAFVSGQQSCAAMGGQVVCQLGTMQPGETRTGVVSGQVLGAGGQPIAMNGVVSATVVREVQVGKPDVVRWGPLVTQRSFPVVVTAQTADISVTKAAPTEVRPGGTVPYKVIVRNQGPFLAENVMLTDTIQAETPVRVLKGDASCTVTGGSTSGSSGGGGTGGQGTEGPGGSGGTGTAGFVCSLGSMAVGGVKKLTLSVQVGPKAAAGAVVKAPARVTTSTIELNTANNTANARTRVVAPTVARAASLPQRVVVSDRAPDKASAEQAAPAPGITELPRTGEQTGRLIVTALGLLGAGALFLVVGRSRREEG